MRVPISGNATSRLNEAVQSDSRRSDQGHHLLAGRAGVVPRGADQNGARRRRL